MGFDGTITFDSIVAFAEQLVLRPVSFISAKAAIYVFHIVAVTMISSAQV